MSEEQVSESTQSAGQMLRKAREAKGLSINEMAKALRLTAAQIENLEADQFLEFRTPTFVRGYLRAYAKQVNIDESALFSVFEQQDNRKPDVGEMRSFSHKEARKRGDKGTMLIGACVVLVVAFGVVGWIYQNSSTSIGEQYQPSSPAVNPTSSSNADISTSTVESEAAEADSSTQTQSVDAASSNDDAFNTAVAVEGSSQDEAENSGNENAVNSENNDDQQLSSEQLTQPVVDSNDAFNEEQTEVESVVTESSATVTSTEDVNETFDVEAGESSITSNDQALSEETSTEFASSDNAESNELLEGSDDSTSVDDALETAEALLEEAQNATTSGDTVTSNEVAESGLIQQVELHFAGECWAKVVDATGETLVLGVKGKDHVSRVQGVSPFQVLLGNPEAVEIYLDGEVVTKPDTPRGAIAKFNLPIVE